MRDTLAKDLEMLKTLAVTEKKAVALKYHLTVSGLNSWLHRIRERRREAREYINTILSIETRNPRLKKILLSAREEGLINLKDMEEQL